MFDIRMMNRRHKVTAAWRIGPSNVPTHILALITDGMVDYQFEDETLRLYKNDMLYLPIGIARAAVPVPPDYHKMMSVHFVAAPSAPADLPVLCERELRIVRLGNAEYAKQRMSTLAELWENRPLYYELQTQAIILELLCLFGRELTHSRYSPRKHAVVQELQRFIHTRYDQRLTLERLAAHVDRTPNYICTLFKDMTGQSPIEYINQIRVNAAHELLLNTEQTVTDIAEQVGFSDPYYFNRVYKKMYGLPPKRSVVE
ncbi:helix-turn-helix transcriptional regulator [Paenibacillus sp. IB182496]|uniref:Helix-turn-helix transcriptional regulator n=1 Tax=Paenibacillus sabuli TaxID=2772509 RepID=A0A927BYJ9_9BACL|nr:AraC family transcriptional regulator [Paenibacillus sabuli]MBD2847864.1 helix-turn-helix transcriptional regulator [Paenibacillus sabuli]